MSRKRFFIPVLFALAAFILYALPVIHGEDDALSGQKKTGYVKSEEGTTGEGDPSAPGAANAPDPASPEGAPAGLPDGKNDPLKPPSMDSDYTKEVPADFNMALPAPTSQEMLAAMSAGSSVGLRLLNASYHYLGVPYKLGGDGVRTTDCSMFTRMSAIRAGLEPNSFRRGAGIQYGYGLNKKFNMVLVSKGAGLQGLQPGDFVFYNWQNAFSRARPYGIGHVGLYIGPTKGKAIYTIEAGNPVNKGWRNTKYLVGFGRIMK